LTEEQILKIVSDVSENINANAKWVEKFQETNIEKTYELIMKNINHDHNIFFKGKGISGGVAKKAAIRLNHIVQAMLKKSGKRAEVRVFFISESSTPKAHKDDLVIIVSGSGNKKTLNPLAEKAVENGANLVLFSTYPESVIGKLATHVVEIPGRVLGKTESSMPLGTTFEMTTDVVLTAIIALIIKRNGITDKDLSAVHTDLE